VHRQARKNLVALWHEGEAEPRDGVGRAMGDVATVEGDAAIADACVVQAEEPRDGAQRGALARAVGSQDGDDPATRHDEADALHGGDGVVIRDLELIDAQ
jgi:hypothetical protein